MKTLSILAALAVVSIGQPALAQNAPARPSVTVAHADLNLANERDAKTLEHRVWRAVVAVCGAASDFDLAGKNDVRQCQRDTLRVASTQTDVVIASANRSEPIRISAVER
jgi:UrcA family protein